MPAYEIEWGISHRGRRERRGHGEEGVRRADSPQPIVDS
jgi:hypothetical protein